jgi:TonB family protein
MFPIKSRLPTLAVLFGLVGPAATGCALAQAPDAPSLKQNAVVDFNSCAKPQYPHEEVAAKHEGIVTLAFQVGTDGKVADSKVRKSSGFPALDERARSALALCSFKPAIAAEGQPVMAWTHVQYVWTLD